MPGKLFAIVPASIGPSNGQEIVANRETKPNREPSARQREIEAHVAELVERVARDSIRREVFRELMEPNREASSAASPKNQTEPNREELQCQLDYAMANRSFPASADAVRPAS